jgi:F-type H+-transporting ATPase subunit alpha
MSQHLNPSEISELIKSRITDLKASAEARNEGTIVSVSDGIVRIHGLADVMYGEMIEFDGGLLRHGPEPRAGFRWRRGAG